VEGTRKGDVGGCEDVRGCGRRVRTERSSQASPEKEGERGQEKEREGVRDGAVTGYLSVREDAHVVSVDDRQHEVLGVSEDVRLGVPLRAREHIVEIVIFLRIGPVRALHEDGQLAVLGHRLCAPPTPLVGGKRPYPHVHADFPLHVFDLVVEAFSLQLLA
jgi:hypothetical protein